jgi:prolyl-tRNA editing enzyme YbaK/EbsC (Cys-tRNA(Pro) deacylase)
LKISVTNNYEDRNSSFSLRIKQIQVIIDPVIAEHEYIICGGGAVNKLYRVRVKDLIEYLKPRFLDIFK